MVRCCTNFEYTQTELICQRYLTTPLKEIRFAVYFMSAIISRGKYKNWTLYSPRQALNVIFLGLVTKLAPPLPSWLLSMAYSCGIKFSFTRKTSLQVQDIWKLGEYVKWLLLPSEQKCFQELAFKAFNAVVSLIASRSYPGGGILPYICFLCMCGPKGCDFSAVLLMNRV